MQHKNNIIVLSQTKESFSLEELVLIVKDVIERNDTGLHDLVDVIGLTLDEMNINNDPNLSKAVKHLAKAHQFLTASIAAVPSNVTADPESTSSTHRYQA